MKLPTIFATSVAAVIFAGAASASTVVCEGGGPGIGPIAVACDVEAGDFGPNPENHAFDIAGHTQVFGSIRDQEGRNGKFQDAWKFTYDKAYNVTFSWENVRFEDVNDKNFRGTLFLNGDDVQDVSQSGSITFWNRTGMDSFVLDAATPDALKEENLRWTVEVSAVPLPAAGWLLLAGVGGLAAMKRKKRSA